MLRRLYLAWRLYSGLHYSWHVAWHKAAYRGLPDAPRRAAQGVFETNLRRSNLLLLRTPRSVLRSDD